jgi:hypothetical protein
VGVAAKGSAIRQAVVKDRVKIRAKNFLLKTALSDKERQACVIISGTPPVVKGRL